MRRASPSYDVIMTTYISVADAKRRFADVLGAVRYRGERFVIERNGTPMAALVPLDDERAPRKEGGFLALVGVFDDAPQFADAIADAVKARGKQRPRPAPKLPA
jgi:prevent-host-death family protein